MTEIPPGPPTGRVRQRHGFWGVFQVVERLTPWVVIPAAALGLTGLDQCQERALVEVCTSY